MLTSSYYVKEQNLGKKCYFNFILGPLKWAKLFLTLCQVKKQQFKVKFWIWGSITAYYNMTCDQFFLSQKSLHPTRPGASGGGTFFRLSYTVYTRTAYQQMFSDQPTVGTWCCSQSSTPSFRLLLSRSLSGSAAGAFSPTPTEYGKPNENFFFFFCGS